MAYLPNIPAAIDLLSLSQGQIQGNFQGISTLVNVDHVDFDLSDQGKHKRVSLPVQSPAPTFGTNEVGMYSFLNPNTNKNELYINKTNQVTVTQIPASASILSVNSAPAALSSGWTYLPSGIILKWAANVNANGQTTVNFPTGADIPVFTTCITALVQIADSGTGDVNKAIRLTGVSNTSIRVYGSVRSGTGASTVIFTYLAIGY